MSTGSSGFIKAIVAVNVLGGVFFALASGAIGPFFLVAIGGTLATLLYLAPTIVAFERGHHNRGAVAALNILLGWAVIPWVAALIWAMSRNTAAELLAQQQVLATSAANPPRTALDRALSEDRACPYCAEQVKKVAIKCKHCGSDLRVVPDGNTGPA